jgi:hypothetical protein
VPSIVTLLPQRPRSWPQWAPPTSWSASPPRVRPPTRGRRRPARADRGQGRATCLQRRHGRSVQLAAAALAVYDIDVELLAALAPDVIVTQGRGEPLGMAAGAPGPTVGWEALARLARTSTGT